MLESKKKIKKNSNLNKISFNFFLSFFKMSINLEKSWAFSGQKVWKPWKPLHFFRL